MTKSVLVFVLWLFACISSLSAADRYASTSGSGSTCSIGSPCTLNTALSGAAANDTIYLRAGSYAAPSANPASGTGGNYTRIRNYCPTETTGETVTVTGTWPPFYSSSANYVKFEGCRNGTARMFTLDNNFTSGEVLIADNGSHHLWVQGMIIKNGGGAGGIYVGRAGCTSPCGFATIVDNEILTNGLHFQLDHGIYLSSADNLVENNDIHNNACYGVQLYNGAGGVHRNIVRGNRIYANGQKANVGGTGTCGGLVVGSGDDNIVTRNQIYGNVINSNGLQMSQAGNRTLVYNNTIDGNSGAEAGLVNGNHVNAVIRNNSISSNGVNFIDTGTGTTKSHNFCTTGGGTANCQLSGASAGYVGAGDFRVAAGSPLLSAGTTFIANCPAPLNCTFTVPSNGAGVEIGAFEVPVYSSCAATGNTMTVTWQNNLYPPMKNASITSLTAVIDGSTRTLSSPSISNQLLTLTFSGAAVASTATFAVGSSSPISDSANIGGSLNQTIHAISAQSCNVTGTGASIAQTHFRFHGLYGPIDTPEIKVATDLPWTIQPGGCIRCRIKLAATGGDPASTAALWRYSRSGGGYTVIPDAYGADNIRFFGTADPSPDIPAQGAAISTELLTSDHATNVNGLFVRSSNAIPTFDLSQNSEIEIEAAFCIDSDEAIDTTFDLRLYNQDGTPFNSYTQTPRLTVKPPSFTTMSAVDIETSNPVQVVVRTKPLGYTELRVDKSMLPLRVNGRQIDKAGRYQ